MRGVADAQMGMTTKSSPRFSHRSRGIVLVVLLLAALTGCSRRGPSPGASASTPPSDVPATAGSAPTVRARAVTIDTTLTVTDVDARERALREITESAGGYVTDATMAGEHDERSGHMELHIPADSLAAFLGKLSGMGEVTGYTERAENVTDQRTDLKARLKNARTQEARIQELMTQKTSTLGETIEAEKELARVRENIERMDAQDRTLDGRVTFATVRISLLTTTVEPWRAPGTSIARAASNGAHGAASIFMFLAMAFVTIAPTLIPIGLAVLAAWSVVRVFGRRKQREALEEDAVSR